MELPFITALIYLSCGIILFLFGLLIFREGTRPRLNRITGAMLFLAALGPILGAFGLLLETAGQSPEVDLQFLNRLYLIWEFFFPQLVLFSLVFPSDHPVLKSHPNLPIVLYMPQAFHLLLALVLPTAESVALINQGLGLTQEWPLILQPVKILLHSLTTLLKFLVIHHTTYFAAINMAYVLTALTVMHFGYQKISNPRLLTQGKWVLWGIRASLGLYAIAILLPRISPLEIHRNHAYLLTIASLLIGSGAIAWAIIRYQFLDVRFLIRHGFVYSLTSGVLVGMYLLVYSKTKSVVMLASGTNLPIVEIFFLILAVMIFQPILGFTERIIERIFFRDVPDYQQLRQTLSRKLLSITDLTQLQKQVTTSLRAALAVENVYLILEDRSASAFTTRVAADHRHEPITTDERHDEVRFERQGQFLRLMAQMEPPVYSDHVRAQIDQPSEVEALERLRPKLFFPLTHHSDLAGILTVGPKLTNEPFSYEDMTFLSLLSNQIAIAIENTQLYQERLAKQRLDDELNVAREIQRMLLPRKVPAGVGFEISAINLPSLEVGGDYYDFVEAERGAIGVAICDVTGKGVPGAILMSNLQAIFRASAVRNAHTHHVISELNSQISRTTSAGKYATFFYGILSPAQRTLAYTNAGHNYPILFRPKTGVSELRHTDLIVGVQESAVYHEHTVALLPDDFLILYTDGITEAINQHEQDFGIEKLFEVICRGRTDSAEGMRNRIYEAVLTFSGDMPQADDLTLVVVKVR